MSAKTSIAWFKTTFRTPIADAIADTPFCENLLAAIAYQETGYLWGSLIRDTPVKEILRVCVGDTIGAPRRKAFPATKADLLKRAEGEQMFQIARTALEDVAARTGQYLGAVKDPDKFCRGFGIFQYDLQAFIKTPDYFLGKEWEDFGQCLGRCIGELKEKMKRLFPAEKAALTDLEKVHLAIAYNTGGFDPAKGLRQGFKDSDGQYYGEQIFAYYQLAQTITPTGLVSAPAPVVTVVEPGREAPVSPLPKAQPPPPYPGRLLQQNSSDSANTRLLQKRLRELGYVERDASGRERPLTADGDFGLNTKHAVELFQFRHTDSNGHPLVVDGTVGPATWAALFGLETLAPSPAPASGSLAATVLQVAAAEVGVREQPPGSNRGVRVEEYLASVGLKGGYAWCAAFVFWSFREASKRLAKPNPAIKTAGVLDLWNRARAAGYNSIPSQTAAATPSAVAPGMVFIFSTGGGFGHTGLVTKVNGLEIETIEGNTDAAGSRNGIGVFRRRRSITSINCGFIDYSRKI